MSAALRHAAALVVAFAALAGCGLPEDQRPRVIAAEDAPLTLDQNAAVESEPGPGTSIVELWLVEGERLQPVDRVVQGRTPQAVIGALLQGVTDGDPPAVTTAIPADTRLLSATFDGTTLVIDLGPADAGIFAIGGAEQKAAFAQLVFTALELEGVTGVRFRVDGQPVTAPTDTGAVSGPLTAADFVSLDPRRRTG